MHAQEILESSCAPGYEESFSPKVVQSDLGHFGRNTLIAHWDITKEQPRPQALWWANARAEVHARDEGRNSAGSAWEKMDPRWPTKLLSLVSWIFVLTKMPKRCVLCFRESNDQSTMPSNLVKCYVLSKHVWRTKNFLKKVEFTQFSIIFVLTVEC